MRLEELPVDGLVVSVGVIGASDLIEERLPGPEFTLAVQAIERHLGRRAVALLALLSVNLPSREAAPEAA